MRYGLGGCRESSLVDIGMALGLSRERARQIEVVALAEAPPVVLQSSASSVLSAC